METIKQGATTLSNPKSVTDITTDLNGANTPEQLINEEFLRLQAAKLKAVHGSKLICK